MAAILRFFVLPAREKSQTIEAALTLFGVRVLLGVLPFRLAVRLLRFTPGKAGGGGRVVAAEADAIGRAIARAARHVPFRAVCLQQAFAALLMLRRRGLAATLHLGVAREPDALSAHAWCRCGAVPVTGAEGTNRYVQVAVFAA